MAFSVQFAAKEPRETGRNVQQQHAQWELYLVRTIRFGCHAEKMMFTKTKASDWDIHNYIIFICYCVVHPARRRAQRPQRGFPRRNRTVSMTTTNNCSNSGISEFALATWVSF